MKTGQNIVIRYHRYSGGNMHWLKRISAVILLLTSCAATARLQRLLPEDYFDPPVVELLQSLERGDEPAARALLASGLTLNIVGRGKITPLFYLYGNEDTEAAQLALKLGADPNFPNGYGNSPVAWFASQHGYDIIEWEQMLLAAGGDPNGKAANGDPLIFNTVDTGSGAEILSMLLAYGADINVQDHTGASILLKLAERELYSYVYWLATEHGADLCVYDNTGTSVADLVNKLIKELEERKGYPYIWKPARLLRALLTERGLYPPLTQAELENLRQQGTPPLCQDKSGKKRSFTEWFNSPEQQKQKWHGQ